MTEDDLEVVFARVRTWAPSLQAAAAEVLLALEGGNKEFYELSDEELADVKEGLAEADRGEFATDEEIAHAFRRRV